VLLLWGALFDLVDVELFSELFSEELFIYTVSGAAAGFGIAVGRDSQRVIGTLRGITLAVFRSLLPLTSFVALLFVATLPFTGLDPLWETGHASSILLAWIGLTVLFLNAVYQDGSSDPPYPRALVWVVEAALLSMVLYAGIALYGTGLRIQQYGLTPTRFYALLFGAVLGLYAIGYAAAVLLRSQPWLAGVRRVNLVMALVVVALGLLLHTRLLDPISWSAQNQFTRLVEGRVEAEDFDFAYLRFKLGRAGARRLVALEDLDAHPQIAAIREAIHRVREAGSYWDWQQHHGPQLRPQDFVVHPPGTEWPEGLFDAMRRAAGFALQRPCHEGDHCAVFPVDVDGEAGDEYVVLLGATDWSQLFVFRKGDLGAWMYFGKYEFADAAERPDADAIRDAIRQSRIETRPSPYLDLWIGGRRFRMAPQ
jgi:hypothetical protein